MQQEDNTTGNLDPQTIALTQAIRQQESGGNPTQKGASGEYGAYQFLPGTWDKLSQEAGVDVPLQQSTLAQQNQVAYHQIKKWKDQGYNPGQIASMWNAGEGEPNAYTGTFKDGQPSVGVNKEGVKFDVPSYAKNVYNNYQQFKQKTPQATQPQKPDEDLMQKAEDIITSLFPGKEIGEAIGTEAAKLLNPQTAQYVAPGPSMGQVAADVGQSALTVAAPGAGEGLGLAGRLGLNALMGAGFGGLGTLAKGGTTGQALQSAGTGALVGGVAGAAGEGLSALSNVLPARIIQARFPNLKQDAAEYLVNNKPLGTTQGMLNDSMNSLDNLGSQINTTLNKPEYASNLVNSQEVYGRTIAGDPEIPQSGLAQSGLTPEQIAKTLKTLVKTKAGLVDKLFGTGEGKGALTLSEAHDLSSYLGSKVFPSRLDQPIVAENKKVGASVYSALSSLLKDNAPEIKPLFNEYSKERAIANVLKKAAQKRTGFGLYDYLSLVAGGSTGFGLPGAIGGYFLRKGLASPVTDIATAKALSGIGKATPSLARIIGGETSRMTAK